MLYPLFSSKIKAFFPPLNLSQHKAPAPIFYTPIISRWLIWSVLRWPPPPSQVDFPGTHLRLSQTGTLGEHDCIFNLHPAVY